MKNAEFQWLASSDPRLAAYAASACRPGSGRPTAAGFRRANPAGARLFGAADAAALPKKTFGPADRHRRRSRGLQAGCLPRRHPAGAIAGIWRGARRACDLRLSRFDFPDGSHGVLIAAAAPIGPRAEPLVRVAAVAAGSRDHGAVLRATACSSAGSDAARSLLGLASRPASTKRARRAEARQRRYADRHRRHGPAPLQRADVGSPAERACRNVGAHGGDARPGVRRRQSVCERGTTRIRAGRRVRQPTAATTWWKWPRLIQRHRNRSRRRRAADA